MIETIVIAVSAELIMTAIALIATIPQIKKELKTLNENFKAANETQSALVSTVIRMEERLENHIHDTHIHKQ